MTKHENYILERMRCDARYALDRARQEGVIDNPTVKGRFREIN